jgi:hypothetical protein
MFNNDLNQNRGNIGTQMQPGGNNANGVSPLGWKDLATQRTTSAQKRRRRILSIALIVLLVALIFSAVRVGSVASTTDDQLTVQIGGQQPALVDLRQSFPISPYLFGVNVFPQSQSSSLDRHYSGFMSYDPPIAQGLANAHINLLRFPGGEWGEKHILSCQQINAFSGLLSQVGADGMMQARISNPVDSTGVYGALENFNLEGRASLAGSLVDYMNNPHSANRTGSCAKGPFHAVKLWSVGNEPDRLNNPDTGKPYTVAQYVQTFIQFSINMHRNDPTIRVFGPEISQFFGPNAGPFDSQGQAWMEGFLKGVGAYEQAHHVTLLDGVSFHRYQFDNAGQTPGMLMSSTSEWNYSLPPLRQEIRQYLGRDVPIAITEINTNPGGNLPTRGQAALWWADTLATLMNQQVEYVSFFSAEGVDTPFPFFSSTKPYSQTPMFRVMQLFTHLQANLVPVDVQREPISLYATQNNASDVVSLLFVNKGASPQLAHVSSPNQVFGVSPWHSMDISIAGYSMVLVTLHRNGDASAYSFDVPTANDPTTAPLTYTVCGNKTDPLANNIPC